MNWGLCGGRPKSRAKYALNPHRHQPDEGHGAGKDDAPADWSLRGHLGDDQTAWTKP